MTFHVGQKVVCVHPQPLPGFSDWDDSERPHGGAIYTVLRFFIDEDGDEILWLVEIARCERACRQWGQQLGYGAFRFRPVLSRSTEAGMAILRQILIDHKSPLREKTLSSSSSFRVTGTNT